MNAVAKLACIDLEGVLIPELWPKIAVRTGIKALFATTREVPDYPALMTQRIRLLRENGITLKEVQDIVKDVQPFEDAAAFLHTLEAADYRVNIISDCFEELALPLLQQLGDPTALCHRLVTGRDGYVTGCAWYPRWDKVAHVEAGLAQGEHVLAVGDAYNDLNMLRRASQGFLINPSLSTLNAAPDVRVVTSLSEVLGQAA